jgi:S-disulfanyl-L-cysteine oxidoreductase SoxD
VAHCASCHGGNIEGQPNWRARRTRRVFFRRHLTTRAATPGIIRTDCCSTKLGIAVAANLKDYKTRMPVFGGTLSEEEIIALLSYIKSRWPEDVRRRHDQLNRVMEERGSVSR